ncbi:Equilibrative nucleoside transporter 3, partial [Taenia solium]
MMKVDEMAEKEEEDILTDGVEFDFEESDPDKPKDKCWFVFCIFVFIGIGTLLPWNFYITATQYFQYQFRNKSLPEGADPLSPMHRTELQKMFPIYLSIASLIPTALANFANLMIKDWYA